jgi:nucleoside-diphosphate-sugar epimerase
MYTVNGNLLKVNMHLLIGIFQKQKEAGVPMTVVGDGEQARDFTYVGDIVKANILAAVVIIQILLGEVFNVGSGKSIVYLTLQILLTVRQSLFQIDRVKLERR